jgi:cytochrome c nitrite reductase small subunit
MEPQARANLLLIVLSVLLGLFFGIGAYTFYYAHGYSYLLDDPQACMNCHIMRPQFDGWQHSSHKAVATCNDCHTPHALLPKYLVKTENGYYHSQAFTLQNFREPIRIRERNARVLQANCLRCHGEFVLEVAGPGTEIDEVHCVRCHAGVGHGPVR